MCARQQRAARSAKLRQAANRRLQSVAWMLAGNEPPNKPDAAAAPTVAATAVTTANFRRFHLSRHATQRTRTPSAASKRIETRARAPGERASRAALSGFCAPQFHARSQRRRLKTRALLRDRPAAADQRRAPSRRVRIHAAARPRICSGNQICGSARSQQTEVETREWRTLKRRQSRAL